MELLLPVGQGATQDCSVPLIPIFPTSLLCNVRVCAAVDTNRALVPVPGKSELPLTRVYTQEKGKSSGAGAVGNYSARTALKGEKSNKRKITCEIY